MYNFAVFRISIAVLNYWRAIRPVSWRKTRWLVRIQQNFAEDQPFVAPPNPSTSDIHFDIHIRHLPCGNLIYCIAIENIWFIVDSCWFTDQIFIAMVVYQRVQNQQRERVKHLDEFQTSNILSTVGTCGAGWCDQLLAWRYALLNVHIHMHKMDLKIR